MYIAMAVAGVVSRYESCDGLLRQSDANSTTMLELEGHANRVGKHLARAEPSYLGLGVLLFFVSSEELVCVQEERCAENG